MLGRILDLFYAGSLKEAINYYELLVHDDDQQLTDRMLQVRKIWGQAYSLLRPRKSRAVRFLRPDLIQTMSGYQLIEINALLPGGLAALHRLSELCAQIDPFSSRIQEGQLQPFPYLEPFRRLSSDKRINSERDRNNIAILAPEIEPALEDVHIVCSFLEQLGHRVFLVRSINELFFEGSQLFHRDGPLDLYLELDPRASHAINNADFQTRLAESVVDGNLTVFPFRYQHPLSYKTVLSLVTDEFYEPLFTCRDCLLSLRSMVPWTRPCKENQTTYRGEVIKLDRFCLAHREKLVVKYSDVSSRNMTVAGRDCDPAVWRSFIDQVIGSRFFVIQEYVTPDPANMNLPGAASPQTGQLVVSPFIYDGEFIGPLVRFGTSTTVVLGPGEGYLCPAFRTIRNNV